MLSGAHLRLADLSIGESRTYWLRSSAAGGEFIGRINEMSIRRHTAKKPSTNSCGPSFEDEQGSGLAFERCSLFAQCVLQARILLEGRHGPWPVHGTERNEVP